MSPGEVIESVMIWLTSRYIGIQEITLAEKYFATAFLNWTVGSAQSES